MAYRASLLIDRFWEKVDRSGGCWLWTGAPREGNIYGQFMTRKGQFERAHRVPFMLTKGEIPHDMQVLHACDNRRCVNPDHLFLGTQADNMRDMISKGRAARGDALNHTPQVGSLNHGSKLSEQIVREFKTRLAKGERRSSAARELGISRANALAI